MWEKPKIYWGNSNKWEVRFRKRNEEGHPISNLNVIHLFDSEIEAHKFYLEKKDER